VKVPVPVLWYSVLDALEGPLTGTPVMRKSSQPSLS
jgi:hypothetical protein